jgi:NADP-dependent 3-hydroxy acid dehydrogenase YdfG
MASRKEPQLADEPPPGEEARLEPQPDWTPRYPGSGRLKGKAALIAGGDSGIGRAVAVLFAREGYDVAIVYFSERGDAEDSCRFIEAEGARAIALRGDIGDEMFCQNAVAKLV